MSKKKKKTLKQVLLIIQETPTVLPPFTASGDPVDVYTARNRRFLVEQLKQEWGQ